MLGSLKTCSHATVTSTSPEHAAKRDGQSIAAILQTAEERGGQTESQEVREGKSEFTDLLGHKRECPPRTESFTV